MWEEIDTYERVMELGLDGANEESLWPWSFYPRAELKDLNAIWPSDGGPSLTAFARRVDCDDLACFEEGSGSVVVVEGWAFGGRGYQRVVSYSRFSEWRDAARKDASEAQ